MKAIQHVIIKAQHSDRAGHELVFEIAVSSNITRTHRFHYSDCEIMSAIFDDSNASYLKCEPKVFIKLLDHFYQSPEISIEASQNFFQVKSFHQEQGQDSTSAKGKGGKNNAVKHMTTGLVVNIQEFEEYEFYDDGEGEGEGSQERSEELVVCSKEVSYSIFNL